MKIPTKSHLSHQIDRKLDERQTEKTAEDEKEKDKNVAPRKRQRRKGFVINKLLVTVVRLICLCKRGNKGTEREQWDKRTGGNYGTRNKRGLKENELLEY